MSPPSAGHRLGEAGVHGAGGSPPALQRWLPRLPLNGQGKGPGHPPGPPPCTHPTPLTAPLAPQVSFTLELEFSCSVLLDRAEVALEAGR